LYLQSKGLTSPGKKIRRGATGGVVSKSFRRPVGWKGMSLEGKWDNSKYEKGKLGTGGKTRQRGDVISGGEGGISAKRVGRKGTLQKRER